MKASVIVESCFGNTLRIAHAVRDGLQEAGAQVELTEVTTAPAVLDADLVVLAAPTHNMGMSSAKTRAQAQEKGAEQVPSAGAREWIANVGSVTGTVVTTSTTTGGSFAGSAGKAMHKALRRKKIEVRRGEDFQVDGTPGPLADGELERAHLWGRSLAR